jgi:hypothetical protein
MHFHSPVKEVQWQWKENLVPDVDWSWMLDACLASVKYNSSRANFGMCSYIKLFCIYLETNTSDFHNEIINKWMMGIFFN